MIIWQIFITLSARSVTEPKGGIDINRLLEAAKIKKHEKTVM